MKIKEIVLIIGLLFFVNCSKNEQIEKILPDGIYTGTFQRVLVWSDNNIANISITISSNKWTGTSSIVKYPALCSGTYFIEGDSITFVNECVWTAEFDWSLILGGKYHFKKDGNVIEFTKDYRSETADTFFDKYEIIKQ